MAKSGQVEISARILIEQPVVDVLHSLQGKDGMPLAARRSTDGDPLSFDFPLRIGPGPRFFGDQVRPEGPERRFVYICVGQRAGDCASPWSRRMKIDVHDTDQMLLDRAIAGDGVLEFKIIGTGADGTPACATIKPVIKQIAPAR